MHAQIPACCSPAYVLHAQPFQPWAAATCGRREGEGVGGGRRRGECKADSRGRHRSITLMTMAFPANRAAVRGLKTLWNG